MKLMDSVGRLRDRIDLHSSYVRVLETPDGQRILRHLMRVGFIYKSTFVQGDPRQTDLNEGTRRLVLGILGEYYRDTKSLEEAIMKGMEDESS